MLMTAVIGHFKTWGETPSLKAHLPRSICFGHKIFGSRQKRLD